MKLSGRLEPGQLNQPNSPISVEPQSTRSTNKEAINENAVRSPLEQFRHKRHRHHLKSYFRAKQQATLRSAPSQATPQTGRHDSTHTARSIVPRRNFSLPQQLVIMKFSALFLLAALPSASIGFMLPGASPSLRPAVGSASTGSLSASTGRTSSVPSMTAGNGGGAGPRGDTSPWSVTAAWRDVVGSASQTKAKVDTTAAEVYAELRKKVLVKQERQSLESQLCSLIRIEGDSMSCKAEEHVRRLASELEALQDNAAAFGSQRTGLAGCWKLIYSTPGADGKAARGSDRIKSIEDISYVSENCRLSHTDTGCLRVYKRVTAPPRIAAAAAAAARAAAGDDTASAVVGGAGSGVGKAGRASATAAGRGGLPKQPLRRRMFFGWRRR